MKTLTSAPAPHPERVRAIARADLANRVLSRALAVARSYPEGAPIGPYLGAYVRSILADYLRKAERAQDYARAPWASPAQAGSAAVTVLRYAWQVRSLARPGRA